MILGRGEAQTEEEVIAEYQSFLKQHYKGYNKNSRRNLRLAPERMREQVGKPFPEWTEEDIFSFYEEPIRTKRYGYCGFLTFLYFRGYVKPSFRVVVAYPGEYVNAHKRAVLPLRRRIQKTLVKLGYYRPERMCGSTLTILIIFLITRQKTLDEITREDFDAFEDQYHVGTKRVEDGRDQKTTHELQG